MDSLTIAAYDNLAQKFALETEDFWDRLPRTFVDKFIEATQGKILDVGSGTGRDALIFKARGLEVLCIDASKAMVEMSSAKGFQSVVADFNNIPFPDASFDGVWAYTSLLHVPKADVHESLKEIYRVLRSGGTFGLGLIEGNTEGYKVTAKVPEPRWISYYEKTEIENLLRQYSFQIIYFEQFKPKVRNYLNFLSIKQ